MRDPQAEIVVWLHGMGAPCDVTHRHSVACVSPSIISIGFDSSAGPTLEAQTHTRPFLHVCERRGQQRLLGSIRLRLFAILPVESLQVCLFEAISCTNLCLPRPRLWAHYLNYAYLRWRGRKTTKVRVTGLEQHINAVLFICPRPVTLVSLSEAEISNIFPMNLMGYLGQNRFAFALNRSQCPASLVKRTGRVALSTIPFDHADTARALGKHHQRESIDWQQLPFSTRLSPRLHIPIPDFALRVREMQVELIQELGSHTFFVARILSDHRLAEAPEFFMIHGLYAAARHHAENPATLPIAAHIPSPQ